MSDGVAPGRLIGERFRLVEPLGRGSAGRVWRAFDERNGQPVAIRLHRGRPGPDPAARVVHPHVVSIFSFGTHEGSGYSAMELVDGVSLATILQEGPVPADEVWRIAAEVCQALHAAHTAGVTHGDLKPGNVLIADRGMVKVGGFTGTGDPRQDMYSLGLLMEAMSGHRDPIVKRLLSRNPYTPAQLYEILTGSFLDTPGAHEGDGEDESERPRLVRLAFISGAVTLAVVVSCAWFLAPTSPPEVRSRGSSTGSSSLVGEQTPAAPPASPKPPPPGAGPAVSTGAGVGNLTASIAAVEAVRAVIAKQLSTGQIQPDAAASLNGRLDDIVRFQSRGQTKQADDRIGMLKSQLVMLRKEGKVTAAGYDEILASLNTL